MIALLLLLQAAPAPAAAAASAPAASQPAQPASEPVQLSQGELELRMDRAIEMLLGKEPARAAPILFFVYKKMAEDELKRDVAQFYLADALNTLGFTQAAVEHYVDVITGRRAPDMVTRALTAVDGLVRRGLIEEQRVIDDVLFGAQFGELEKTTQGFVDYYQALGEFRRGYSNWGEAKLEALLQGDSFYAYRARYALGTARLQQDNKDGAEKLFMGLLEDKSASREAKNEARAAMARLRYEQKQFAEAFDYYAQIDSPPSSQAVILLEKAWSKIAAEDEQRALGMTVGLGAPLYRRSFAPERDLIRAISLNRLCQFRAAHNTVLAFRERYGPVLRRIRDRDQLTAVPLLVEVARSREEIRELERIAEVTQREKEALERMVDPYLKKEQDTLYATRLSLLERRRDRRLETLLEKTADDLLSVDEQMSILDYEIGIGLFKRVTNRTNQSASDLPIVPPTESPRAFFKFHGEYWTDELNDFAILVRDRCVR